MVALLAAISMLRPSMVVDEPGAYLQRTMQRLATSRPGDPDPVRIVFYGQSITEPGWTKLVEADLRRRYPDARLEVMNLAVPGFASQLLSRLAPLDFAGLNPDLVILHVYGGQPEYERLVRVIRSSSIAEVLLQTDHETGEPKPGEDRSGYEWSEQMSGFIRDLAGRLQCGVVDVRTKWRDELDRTKRPASDFLSDGVHLNDLGRRLMARIISQHLVRDPEQLSGVPENAVRRIEVGPTLRVGPNTLRTSFIGRRVRLVFGPGEGGTVRALLNELPPSLMPELVSHGRPGPAPGGWPPAFRTIGRTAPLVPDDYTLEITSVEADKELAQFKLTGKRQGEMGTGNTKERFVSKDGQVVLDPEDWTIFWAVKIRQQKLEPGFKVEWSAKSLGLDSVAQPKVPAGQREVWVTIADGLVNKNHDLELTLLNNPSLRAIVIDRPPLLDPGEAPGDGDLASRRQTSFGR